MRTIFIGDVHGCIAELNQLLDELEVVSTDRLIFLGDLINRGPDSLAVLQLVQSISAESIAGNHELGFANYIRQGKWHPGYFEDVRIQLGKHVEAWVEWISKLPIYIEDSDWLAVHAGLEPGVRPRDSSAETLTRIRTWDGEGKELKSVVNPPWHQFYNGSKPIIYGHWASQGLHLTENTICIDTGCVWGGRLTALIWSNHAEERRFVHVDAKEAYCTIPVRP